MTISPMMTIVLPTHNRPVLLAEAIRSISRQTLTDWELIVVDDGSVPSVSIEEVRSLTGSECAVRIITNSSSVGGAMSKNVGARAAQGRYLAFLDDDDMWAPNYLQLATDIFERNQSLDVIFMGVGWFGEMAEASAANHQRGVSLILDELQIDPSSKEVIDLGEKLFEALLKRIPMPFQRPVVSVENFNKIGEYQADCLLWDCEWALRAALSCHCALLTEPVYLQRASGQGYSSVPQKALDHALSNVTMKANLLRRPEIDSKGVRKIVTDSLFDAWFDYAWRLTDQKQLNTAQAALREAARLQFNMKILKLGVKILLAKIH